MYRMAGHIRKLDHMSEYFVAKDGFPTKPYPDDAWEGAFITDIFYDQDLDTDQKIDNVKPR